MDMQKKGGGVCGWNYATIYHRDLRFNKYLLKNNKNILTFEFCRGILRSQGNIRK